MRLRPESSPFPRLLVWPLLALGVFACFWLRWKPELILRAAHCPLLDTFGVPCPTCGGTRAAILMARWDLGGAWMANPLVTMAAIVGGVWTIWALVATWTGHGRVRIEGSDNEKKAARIGAAVLLIAGWWWQIVH